jgi:hypothetical protein
VVIADAPLSVLRIIPVQIRLSVGQFGQHLRG